MFFDFARKFQITFQDPATPIAEGIIDLHHEIFHWLIIIFVPVVVIFLRIVIRSIRVWSDPQTIKNLQKRRLSYAFSGITHGTLLEIIWTITPTIILILIAIPSFGLIYAMDTIIDPDFTIKVIGNQWYRTYDFNYRAFLLGDINDIYASVLAQPVIAQPGLDTPVSVLRTSAEMSDTALKKYLFEQTARLWSHNLKNHLIDSYMLSENVLTKKKGVRLLSVDNPITLPIFTNIRVLITASDVLHSFAIPSFGIKMDATPGRLSAVPLFIERPGIFYGQCSELCGIGHGMMPIEVIAYSQVPFQRDYLTEWLEAMHEYLSRNPHDITKQFTRFSLLVGLALKKKKLGSLTLQCYSDLYENLVSHVLASPYRIASQKVQVAREPDQELIKGLPTEVLVLASASLLLDIICYIDDLIVSLESEQNSLLIRLAALHEQENVLNNDSYFPDSLEDNFELLRTQSDKAGVDACIAFARDKVEIYINRLTTTLKDNPKH